MPRPAGTQDYVFTASRPGTFLYEAGPTPSGKQQVAMGLAGALVVLPTTPGRAYAAANTAYDTEDVLVLSEIDPALNGLADPATFNLRDFNPKFVLVNGQPAAHAIPATQNQKLLVRYVNAGAENHWAGLLGLHQARIGTNAEPLANLLTDVDQEQSGVVAALPAGGTAETLIQVPDDAAKAGFTYPVFDEGRALGEAGDDMIAYVAVGGTLGLPTCPVGRPAPAADRQRPEHAADRPHRQPGGAERGDERVHRHGPRARVPGNHRRGARRRHPLRHRQPADQHDPAARRRERRLLHLRSARRTWRRSRPAAGTT